MNFESIFVFACISIFSLVLCIASFLSYWKYNRVKLLFIGGVFLLFFIRSILLSLSLFYPSIEAFTSSIYIWLFDVAILVILYETSLKR